MSMKLNSEALLAIQTALRELRNVQIRVTEMEVAEHRVILEWSNGEPYVKGILQAGEHKSGMTGMTMRGGN